MPWSTERNQTKLIHTHSTNEYLGTYVRLDDLPSASCMLFSSELAFQSWHRSWKYPRMRLVGHLNVSWRDMKDLLHLKRMSFPVTLNEDGLLVWTDAMYKFLDNLPEN